MVRLCSRRDNFKVVKNILQSAWPTSASVRISKLEHNLIQCTFSNHEDMELIFKKSPWSVKSSHIILKIWPAHSTVAPIDFSTFEFSVQVYTPPDRFNLERLLIGIMIPLNRLNLTDSSTFGQRLMFSNR